VRSGVKIRSRHLGGAEIVRTESLREGRLPLTTSAPISTTAFAEAKTTSADGSAQGRINKGRRDHATLRFEREWGLAGARAPGTWGEVANTKTPGRAKPPRRLHESRTQPGPSADSGEAGAGGGRDGGGGVGSARDRVRSDTPAQTRAGCGSQERWCLAAVCGGARGQRPQAAVRAETAPDGLRAPETDTAARGRLAPDPALPVK